MTTRPPLVSVIVPAYNAAATIREALASLQEQTVPAWEAIVADDGSTDDTPRIVTEAAATDPRIKLVRLGRNTGLPACARNAALAHARGKWIAFLDADDLWEDNKLANQLTALKTARKKWAFSNSRFFGGGEAHPDGLKYPRSWSPPRPFFPALLSGEGVPFLTVIVHRKLLASISPDGRLDRAFDENPALKAVEDSDLTLRLARIAEPAYCARPQARYRAHPGGISKRADANLHARCALIAKHRALGADPALCRRAENRQFTCHAIDLLFERRPAWRGRLLSASLRPPIGPREIFFAALSLLPASTARFLYRRTLAAIRNLR